MKILKIRKGNTPRHEPQRDHYRLILPICTTFLLLNMAYTDAGGCDYVDSHVTTRRSFSKYAIQRWNYRLRM